MFERKTTIAMAGEGQQSVPDFAVEAMSAGEPSWAEEHSEGQLAVDVFETETELVVVATMAGTRAEDIELHLQNDFLTIRGTRQPPIASPARVFYEECYWGRFSRTIVLPTDVASELARSEYKNGVLIVSLPKVRPKQPIPILVVEE
ncbi:MAG: Hsp20/alpha crystallin family protein [Candidatus Magasanikbacteria bacterium]|nr:Hsp20/alpha crystallin family protein [Candidatus Magasanikbacteria bacterium]